MGLVLELWDNFEFFADVPTVAVAVAGVGVSGALAAGVAFVHYQRIPVVLAPL